MPAARLFSSTLSSSGGCAGRPCRAPARSARAPDPRRGTGVDQRRRPCVPATPSDSEPGRARAAAPGSRFRDGELERLDDEPRCEEQLTPEQADGRRDRGCEPRGAALQRGQGLAARLVADLPEREDGIVLKRPVELGDLDERRARRRPCSRRAPRCHAAEEVLALHDEAARRRGPSARRRKPRARASTPAARTRSSSSSSARAGAACRGIGLCSK